MAGLTPEQSDYFARAERVFGSGEFSEKIEDAREDLIRRNSDRGIVRGESRVIGFVPEKQLRRRK